ncbi:hypothetical protein MX629_04845 [Carnobacterium divergens]|uniref:Uncharacterized protein n=1 Tax=Carnobacterium divergens TaxID=2748 RepID=A0AAW8R6D3_CARDV|nr:hypothetical protein [Carnobacterium divergens]MDT1957743.1 hypothetical protein [Carnobacterium divergens]MDT1973371.1 hypothetical protein [Carnobacterium divergens]
MEKIEMIQKVIEDTEYWDARVFDCETLYFGDEVHVIFEGEENQVYTIKFMNCYKVSYQNSFAPDTNMKVKDMGKGQLGYFMQDISMEKYGDNEEFIECSLNLSIMMMSIVCKDIVVEELDKKNISFFWEDE